MGETWQITAYDREAIIQTSADTILGMSLVSPVTVSVGDASTGWRVWVIATKPGDVAWIACPYEGYARLLAETIVRRVKSELLTLPPFSGRQSIALADTTTKEE